MNSDSGSEKIIPNLFGQMKKILTGDSSGNNTTQYVEDSSSYKVETINRITIDNRTQQDIQRLEEEIETIKKLISSYNNCFDPELLEIWDNEEDDVWDTY